MEILLLLQKINFVLSNLKKKIHKICISNLQFETKVLKA